MAYNPDNCQQGKNNRSFGKKTQDKLAKKLMPLKKSGGNFSPVLSPENVDFPSRSHYCTLIRTTATPIFPSFSFSMSPMSCIYCHFSQFVYLPSLDLLPLCFLSYPVVSLILPGITFRLLPGCFWLCQLCSVSLWTQCLSHCHMVLPTKSKSA